MLKVKVKFNKAGQMTSSAVDGPTFEQIQCEKIIFLPQIPKVGDFVDIKGGGYYDTLPVTKVHYHQLDSEKDIFEQIAATIFF